MDMVNLKQPFSQCKGFLKSANWTILEVDVSGTREF